MLVLIDRNLTNKDISLLVKWRNKNKFAYKEPLTASIKSMKWWLENHYYNKKRILFWVVYRGRKIGTMGLRLGSGYCEIDSCMRGEDYGKGQMGVHLEELIKIAFKIAEKLYLKVIKNNEHAILFYSKHGFSSCGTEDVYLKMEYI